METVALQTHDRRRERRIEELARQLRQDSLGTSRFVRRFPELTHALGDQGAEAAPRL